MRFKEIITELFDPKLAIDLEWAEGSDYVAARGYVTVTNPDGYGGEYGNEEEVELEIEFGEYPHPQRKEYEVQFKVDESFAITGGGMRTYLTVGSNLTMLQLNISEYKLYSRLKDPNNKEYYYL